MNSSLTSINPSEMVALAAVAHPDDVEFMMAGTLLLLKAAGVQVHIWNLGNGSCGTAVHSREEIVRLRWQEAQDAARVAGAQAHAPLFDDLAIFYDAPSLAKVGSVIREIRPNIILTHSLQDYMEDHQNSCRLIMTAAFARGMVNFIPQPPRDSSSQPVALYHALPHGLKGVLREEVKPHFYVDISSVIEEKARMLEQHRSQKDWLDVSQGMGAYVNEMKASSGMVGKASQAFAYAEGWRRHSHLGFAAEDFDPVSEILRRYVR